MHPGLQHSQTFTCQQPLSSAQGTVRRGRLALQNPVCTFAKLDCTLGRVPYCAARKGRATTHQQPGHRLHTRQHRSGRIRRQCQQEPRFEAPVQDSAVPEPGSGDQQGNSETHDEPPSTSDEPSRYVVCVVNASTSSCTWCANPQHGMSDKTMPRHAVTHKQCTKMSNVTEVSAVLQCLRRLGWLTLPFL